MFHPASVVLSRTMTRYSFEGSGFPGASLPGLLSSTNPHGLGGWLQPTKTNNQRNT